MKKFWQVPICGIILVLPLAQHPKPEAVRTSQVRAQYPGVIRAIDNPSRRLGIVTLDCYSSQGCEQMFG